MKPCCHPTSERNAGEQPGNLSLPPSRAATEFYLLFNSSAVFTSKAAPAAAHALGTVNRSQTFVNTTVSWKFTSDVPSFTFPINYLLTDVWLNQLFDSSEAAEMAGLDSSTSSGTAGNNIV